MSDGLLLIDNVSHAELPYMLMPLLGGQSKERRLPDYVEYVLAGPYARDDNDTRHLLVHGT